MRRRWSAGQKLLLAAFLAGLGVLDLANAIGDHRRMRSFQASGLSAEATLQRVEVRRYSRSADSFELHLQYVAGAQPVATVLWLEGSAGERFADARPGTVVPILYRPDDPSRVMLTADARTKSGDFFVAGLFAIVCLGGSVLLVFSARGSRPGA